MRRVVGTTVSAHRGGDDAAFRAWCSDTSASARAARCAALAKSKRKPPPLELCAACAALDCGDAALDGEAARAAEESYDALAAWRQAAGPNAAAAATPALPAAGDEPCICGVGEAAKRSRAARPRACCLHTRTLSASELAAHAQQHAADGEQPLLEWPSVEDFTAALDLYLTDRLLCMDCRVNVLRSFRELCSSAASPVPCGCSLAFCTSLHETGQPETPDCAYTLSDSRITGDWAAAFPDCGDALRFEWSVGGEAGADDTRAWTPTPSGGPRLDCALPLDAEAAHYINLRAVFAENGDGEAARPPQTLACRAQPMFGEACAHLRFLLSGGRVGLTAPSGLQAFFEHAAVLQAEDAAEAESAAACDETRWDANAADVGADESAEDAAHDSHVDTPELACEALLDAACVLIKGRVERSARAAAAAAHVCALAAEAAASGVEAVLRAEFDEMAADARQAELLAELEAEAAAARDKEAAAALRRSKKSKKAKGHGQEASPAPAEPKAQDVATSPEPTPEAPLQAEQLASALAALAPFPASPPATDGMHVGTPPREPASWQLQTPASAAAVSEADDGTWSAVQGRRRRRLSSANGSRESLLSASPDHGEASDAGYSSSHGAGDFPALRAPPPQPRAQVQTQRSPAARPRTIPSPLPAPLQQSTAMPPLQRLSLYSAPPLPPLPPQMPASPSAYFSQYLPPFSVRAFPTAAFAAPQRQQQPTAAFAAPQRQQQVPAPAASAAPAAPSTPLPDASSPQPTPTAAFYDSGGFGLFQLPIGGGGGGYASLF